MVNSEKIIIKENETLKLSNVLIREISEKEIINIDEINHIMGEYIKFKKNSMIGFAINYSKAELDENGKAKIIVKIMSELKNPIDNIEYPYKFKREIEVKDCLFARFYEKEENIKFAFKKLRVYAFEKNIQLEGELYTVFIKKDKNNTVADIFMK